MKKARGNHRKKRLLNRFAYRKSPNYNYLKHFYDKAAALALEPKRGIPSDFCFQIEGFPQNYLLKPI